MKDGQYIRLLKENQSIIDKFCIDHEYIYRYLPLERLLEVLQKQYLVFASPLKWNDPFDNFLFKKVESEFKNTTFLNSIFASCFTLNNHSQAYWKTYAPEGYSVRIKIISKNFFELMSKSDSKVWFGKLKYLYEPKLIETFKQTSGLKNSLRKNEPDDTFLKLFHLKRMPFEYEKEVRMLIQSTPTKDNLKKVEIDLKSIIKDIYLDPRMGIHETTALKEYLKKFELKVSKSRLFEEKQIKII